MIELVEYLVKQLAEEKDQIEVVQDGNTITVTLAKSDMGKVIGKQGKIIKAIRTIVKAGCTKDQHVTVDVIEKA